MRNLTHDFPPNSPSLDEAVSEVILPLCKGELEGVEHHSNMVYPPSPSLTKGGNKFGNNPIKGEGTFGVGFGFVKWLESGQKIFLIEFVSFLQKNTPH